MWWRRSRHCSTDASDQPGYEKDCHRFGFRSGGCFSSCPDAAGGVVQAFRRCREPLEQGARQADLRTLHARPVPRDRRQYRGLPERRRRLAQEPRHDGETRSRFGESLPQAAPPAFDARQCQCLHAGRVSFERFSADGRQRLLPIRPPGHGVHACDAIPQRRLAGMGRRCRDLQRRHHLRCAFDLQEVLAGNPSMRGWTTV